MKAKKLISLLLSVLMLASMLPAGTVFAAAPTVDIIYVQSDEAEQVTLNTMKTWDWSTHYFAYADAEPEMIGEVYCYDEDDIIQLALEPSKDDGEDYIGCCTSTSCQLSWNETDGVFEHNAINTPEICPVVIAGKNGDDGKTKLVYLGTTDSVAYEFKYLEAEVSATVQLLEETVEKYYYKGENGEDTIKQSDLTVKATYKNASDEEITFTVDPSEYTLTGGKVDGQNNEPKVTYNGHDVVVPYSWMDDMTAIDDPTANAPFDTAKTGASDRFYDVKTYGEAVYDNVTKTPNAVSKLTDSDVKNWVTSYYTYTTGSDTTIPNWAYHTPYDVQYTVAYQPYNSFTSVDDGNGYNQAANGSYSFKSNENVYLNRYNTLQRGVLDKEMLHEAGLYTITARVYYYYYVNYYCANHG